MGSFRLDCSARLGRLLAPPRALRAPSSAAGLSRIWPSFSACPCDYLQRKRLLCVILIERQSGRERSAVMLTKAELLVAAECAEKYPPGHGYLFLSCDDPDDWGTNDTARERLRDSPSLAQYG